jgi:hypothetical protein
MTDRGMNFMATWVQSHVNADISAIDDDVKPVSFVEKCIADAQNAGISVTELEDDVGDLEMRILQAMDVALDESSSSFGQR